MRYLITGSYGRLGSELKKHFRNSLCPGDMIMDITNDKEVWNVFRVYRPDVVIHCAAMTDVSYCERNPLECFEVNAVGTYNLLDCCNVFDVNKFVYISTDHVFDGTKGNYKENDTPNPQGAYAQSKRMGEIFTLTNPDNLVIRTCFMKEFPFERAYTDKYFNAETVEQIAKWIAKAVKGDLKGIWHIAGLRKSIYDFAKTLNPDVKPMKLEERPRNKIGIPYLKDPSMDVSKWMKYLEKS